MLNVRLLFCCLNQQIKTHEVKKALETKYFPAAHVRQLLKSSKGWELSADKQHILYDQGESFFGLSFDIKNLRFTALKSDLNNDGQK